MTNVDIWCSLTHTSKILLQKEKHVLWERCAEVFRKSGGKTRLLERYYISPLGTDIFGLGKPVLLHSCFTISKTYKQMPSCRCILLGHRKLGQVFCEMYLFLKNTLLYTYEKCQSTLLEDEFWHNITLTVKNTEMWHQNNQKHNFGNSSHNSIRPKEIQELWELHYFRGCNINHRNLINTCLSACTFVNALVPDMHGTDFMWTVSSSD